MSILFTPFNLGPVEIKNRFVFSACEDNLADEGGQVTEASLRKVRMAALGRVGLIISSHLSIHPWGRTRIRQLGIHDDRMIPGLKRLVDTVHKESGKILFQLGHAGLTAKQEVIGRSPLGPSTKDNPMDDEAIHLVLSSFLRAAERTAAAGADGIQIHAAHGYLVHEFLSPFFNQRTDSWGGSEENRFRFLRKIIVETRKILPPEMALTVKLNVHDYTRQEGITPPLAVGYARRLAVLGIDGLEISCGTSAFSPWTMCRGEVPVPEILRNVESAKRPRVEETLQKTRDNFRFEEGYNLDKTIMIRPVMGNIPLFAVGGWRTVSAMEEAVQKGHTDLISMCRPFIREPSLVRKIQEGKVLASSCTNCNRCLMALAADLPGRCYVKGLPE